MNITKQLPITISIYEDRPDLCDPNNCRYFNPGETELGERESCDCYFRPINKKPSPKGIISYGYLYERLEACLKDFGIPGDPKCK